MINLIEEDLKDILQNVDLMKKKATELNQPFALVILCNPDGTCINAECPLPYDYSINHLIDLMIELNHHTQGETYE